MALELPLSILDTISLAKSIANYTDGNITSPKGLLALGDTEFGVGERPHAISEWVGIETTQASLFTLGTVGSDGTIQSDKCTCISYSPALGASQSWCACVCWNLHTTNDSSFGDGSASARIVCNGVTLQNCSVTSLVGAVPQTCSGSWLVQAANPITSSDCVELDVFTSADDGGSGTGYGCASMNIYSSATNINGTVNIGAPSSVDAWSCAC